MRPVQYGFAGVPFLCDGNLLVCCLSERAYDSAGRHEKSSGGVKWRDVVQCKYVPACVVIGVFLSFDGSIQLLHSECVRLVRVCARLLSILWEDAKLG
jgi:hypothetical protein